MHDDSGDNFLAVLGSATEVHELSPDEIALNRQGKSEDPKRGAAARFARLVTQTRGKVTDEDLAQVREAGWSDAEVIAIVALGAQFLMTNFLNNVADTTADFPSVAGPVAA